MADEPVTNAAVEWIRRSHEFVNRLDGARPEWVPVTDDFSYEDRRSGGFNFGRLERSGIDSYFASMWEVGSGRPRMAMPEVVAVRGDRSGAVNEVIDFGEDTVIEGIVCLRLDRTLRRAQRVVILDPEDRDAAIVELDRMHAEIDD